MKALFTTNPGLGHFQPMVPVARGLREAGHEVAFACAASFAPVVEAAGFASFPAGLDWLESSPEAAFPELAEDVTAGERNFWFLTEIFARAAPLRMIPDLLALSESWRPDLVVRNDFEFAGPLVAEMRGIPHATIGLSLYLPAVTWRLLVGKQLAELRAAFGLAPDPELAKLCPDLYLSLMPASYQFPETPLPASFHALQSHAFDGAEAAAPPAWLDRLPDRPTILATMGTVFNRTARVETIFRSLIEGLDGEDVNLILTVGHNQDPDRFGAPSTNVWIERYVPHSHLLPRCALAITQGASSTTKAALGRGLPVLVIPLYGEDPFHAMRCAALGVGLVIRERDRFEPYLYDRTFGELSPRTVRDAVRELLTKPDYRENARKLAGEMSSLPGPRRAVELLEGLAAR